MNHNKKLLSIIFVLIFISSNLNFGLSSESKEESNSSNILIISTYDTNEQRIVNSILDIRKKLDPNVASQFIDIKNPLQIFALTNTKNLSNLYSEFWFITDYFPDINVPSELLSLLLFEKIPGLILSSNLNKLSFERLNLLGVSNCSRDKMQLIGNTTFYEYNDRAKYSSYLNGAKTSIKPWNNGSIDLSVCSLSEDSNQIIDLYAIDSNNLTEKIPVLFRPTNRSKIVISPLMLKNIVSDINNENFKINDPFNLNLKLNQNIGLDLFSIFSITSFLNINNFQSISIDNILSPQTSQPITTGTETQFTGTSGSIAPNLDPNENLFNNLFTGSIILALLSMLVLFFRKYWIYLIGLLIGLLALFKVPSRKISVMEVYENPTRQKILDILTRKKGQGETVRNIAKKLSTPLPTLLWHFEILVDFELIIKEKVRRESVLISAEFIKEFDTHGKILKEFELTFKTDKAKNIFNYLLSMDKNDQFSIAKLVNVTHYSKRTIKRYINKLLDLKIIDPVNPVHPKKTKDKTFKISSLYYDQLKKLYQ